jgi:hypothetical protein
LEAGSTREKKGGGKGGGKLFIRKGDNQHGSFSAEKMKYTAFLYIIKLILAAMCLRRVGIDSHSYAAVPTQVSAVAMPPAPAATNLGVVWPKRIFRKFSRKWYFSCSAKCNEGSYFFCGGQPLCSQTQLFLRIK